MRYFHLLFITLFALSLPIYGYASAAVWEKQDSCPMQQSDQTMNTMDCCQGMSKVTHLCSSTSGCTTAALFFLPTKIAPSVVVFSTAPLVYFDTAFIKSPSASIWRPPA